MKNITRISTINMSHEDWLAHRKGYIGGSDAAAIIGLNPYASPYSVWADKTNRLPEKEDNEAMRQGRDLEDYVAQRWCEATGKKVRRANAILHNSQYPYAHANVDRLVVGEDAGLECKTTSILNLKKFKDGNYPETYYVQCVHYMAVTGLQRWHLAVLVLNQGFYTFTIERDEGEIEALMRSEADFWEYVKNDTPPPVDGSAATTAALGAIYADTNDMTVALFGRDTLLSQYFDLIAQKKQLENDIEQIKQTIMNDMGDAEKAISDAYAITWKSQQRQTFDHKAFLAENPNIDIAPYFKTSNFKKITIKEI